MAIAVGDMKMIIHFLILINAAPIMECRAQQNSSPVVPSQSTRPASKKNPPSAVLTGKYYQKVTVPKNEWFALEVDSVRIDTLIMQDNSTLHFMALHSYAVVHDALIGEKCEFDAAGRYGFNGYGSPDGTNGDDGRNLTITIGFNELKDLSINTSGGKGGSGANGKKGAGGQSGAIGFNDGARGQAGGNGGNGGNGGALKLLYESRGFLPTFNGKGHHRIQLNFAGGKGGSFGMGGKGGSGGQSQSWLNGSTGAPGKPGSFGPSGSSGLDGKDGELILERLKN